MGLAFFFSGGGEESMSMSVTLTKGLTLCLAKHEPLSDFGLALHIDDGAIGK